MPIIPPTTAGTGSESTAMCILDILSMKGATNALAVPAGLLLGLAIFFSTENSAVRSNSPVNSWRMDRTRVAVQVFTIAVLIGVATLPLAQLALIAQLVLAGSLMTAVLAGKAQIVFSVTAAWLAARNQLPWRLFTFLNYAHRIGLLRVAGSAYQFRHAELLSHLTRSAGSSGKWRR